MLLQLLQPQVDLHFPRRGFSGRSSLRFKRPCSSSSNYASISSGTMNNYFVTVKWQLKRSIGEIKRLLAGESTHTLPVSCPKMALIVVIDYLEITFVSLPSKIYSFLMKRGNVSGGALERCEQRERWNVPAPSLEDEPEYYR